MSLITGIIAMLCFGIASRYPQPDGSPHEALTIWAWFFTGYAVVSLCIEGYSAYKFYKDK